jgi:nitroimidazol reductase NimA-like FMN-containing flavoprotein (pyridoxamine 5'-phosphate oxidase superfamily)
MVELTEFGRLRTSGNKKRLPRPEMEKRIQAYLDACNVCVLATSLDDVPRATPIEYYAKDLVVYIAASPQTKIRNLEGNSRCSIGIYNTPYTDWTNWYEVKGIQITGRTELIRNEEQPVAYAAALEVYDWRKYREAMGIEDAPHKTIFIRVIPQRIEFRDLGLMREGYAPTQVWESTA